MYEATRQQANLDADVSEDYDMLSWFNDYVIMPVSEGFEALFNSGPSFFEQTEEQQTPSEPWGADDFASQQADLELAQLEHRRAEYAGTSRFTSPYWEGGADSLAVDAHQRRSPADQMHLAQDYLYSTAHHPMTQPRFGEMAPGLNNSPGPSVVSDVLAGGTFGAQEIAAGLSPMVGQGLDWLGGNCNGTAWDEYAPNTQSEEHLQRVPRSPSSADGLGLHHMYSARLLGGDAVRHGCGPALTSPPPGTPPVMMGPTPMQAPFVPTPPDSPEAFHGFQTQRLAAPRQLPGTGLQDVTSEDLLGRSQGGHCTPGGGVYSIVEDSPYGRFGPDGLRLAAVVA